MFRRFTGAFKVTGQPVKSGTKPDAPSVLDSKEYRWLMAEFGGATFEHGLYRLRAANEIRHWNAIVGEAFPEFAARISCFGYDWLGRHFALDFGRMKGRQPLVAMLEPGTGEVLEIPADFVQFHNAELVDFTDAVLARDFFLAWRRTAANVELHSDQCVGYKIPLFLGGSDTVDNLEVIDAEVYWVITGQLRRGTRWLPPGTTIRAVTTSA